MRFAKIATLASLTAVLLCAGAPGPHRAAAADSDDDPAPLCLAVTDKLNSVVQISLTASGTLRKGGTVIVSGNLNGTEPVLGVAFDPGSGPLILNLQGTVAGFFTVMQLKYDPAAGAGTGRVIGELTAHTTSTVTRIPCNRHR